MAERGDRAKQGREPGRRATPARAGGLAPWLASIWSGADRRSCATGRAPRPARAGCCHGCRSRSAPASRCISPPTTSRSPGSLRSARRRLAAVAVSAAPATDLSARGADRRDRPPALPSSSLKAARIAHPVLAKPVYAVSLQGFVETREERERTDRFVLRVAADRSRPRDRQARSGCGCRCGRAPRRRSAASSP